MIKKFFTIKQPAHLLYKDKETFDFELILGRNYYTNMKNIHVCFPIRFKKSADETANLAADLIPVNNFFAQWVKEIDITKCGTNKSFIPTTTPLEIYRYSEPMQKHVPKDTLNMIQNNLLYSEKAVVCIQRTLTGDYTTTMTQYK